MVHIIKIKNGLTNRSQNVMVDKESKTVHFSCQFLVLLHPSFNDLEEAGR